MPRPRRSPKPTTFPINFDPTIPNDRPLFLNFLTTSFKYLRRSGSGPFYKLPLVVLWRRRLLYLQLHLIPHSIIILLRKFSRFLNLLINHLPSAISLTLSSKIVVLLPRFRLDVLPFVLLWCLRNAGAHVVYSIRFKTIKFKCLFNIKVSFLSIKKYLIYIFVRNS